MEQQTVTIKKFSRIENPDIHYRLMTYPPERKREKERPRSSGYVIPMSVIADMLSANNEKRRNLIYNVLNGNKHRAANGYDKELFADCKS